MGRFDYDYDYDQQIAAMWEGRVKAVLSGRPGYRQLKEMEAALLALPQPRLIYGAVCREGEVCAVGAYALFKRMAAGETREQALAGLEALNITDDDEYDSASRTAELGKKEGMSYTLAWLLGEKNDDDWGIRVGATPEQRYLNVLAWVRKTLANFPEKART